jgi:hypothetical protein
MEVDVTQTKEMAQRLIRGTQVSIADSFGQAHLRGSKQIVASKGPVKCNGKGRCAGDWCIGLAVFLTDPDSKNDEKDMGWRSGTTKVCLTHVKDEEGNLVLPPPALRVAHAALEPSAGVLPRAETADNSPVSWEELAQVCNERDLGRLVLLSRRLKRENESLRQRLIDTQERLLSRL